jgi:hypothetical protein
VDGAVRPGLLQWLLDARIEGVVLRRPYWGYNTNDQVSAWDYVVMKLYGDRLSLPPRCASSTARTPPIVLPRYLPDAVAFAQSTEEVSEIVKNLRAAQGADDPVWAQHIAGGPCGGAVGRGYASIYRR